MSNEPKPVTAEKLYDDLNSWIGGKMPRHFVISKIREALGSCAAAARKQALDEAMSFYPYGAAQAALKSKPSEHDMPRKKINPNEVPTLLCDALDLLEQANKKTVNRFKSEHIVEAIRRVRLAIKMSVGAQ